ncbi:hypothetical protein, variant 2 [Exophiala mesophila]|nr:hypothetical protein, variant 1 [Exophiala mesophila]XP_016225438.1 hypothetical protein, variant 2 [Exophiala mesophila]KIV93863.1 hypothetical protein, variant 1 [Exophiala mesophila]KIV93864.1 hypothetical protein, variant 2 [Exophiala mesophila]
MIPLPLVQSSLSTASRCEPLCIKSTELGKDLLIAKLPAFLAPHSFKSNLETVQAALDKARSRDEYSSILPDNIARHLIEASFEEISLPRSVVASRLELTALFDQQRRECPKDPGSNPAIWVLINAAIALAIRAKTVDTPALRLSEIASAYHRNATKALGQVLLAPPSVLSVRALLAMAVASRVETGQLAALILANSAKLVLEAILSQSDSGGASDDLSTLRLLHDTVNRLVQDLKRTRSTDLIACAPS